MDAQAVLHDVFGYTQFRGQQADIIQHVVEGNSALVLMPTGGGKSLCYQLPALLREGLTIVVSPLISLMQDQVDALVANNVRAAYLNSSLSQQQAGDVYRLLRSNSLDLLYIAPERLVLPNFLEFLDTLPLALFAIDEAHCVSHWGHEFRPEYMQLSIVCERYPTVPRLALTATADEMTRREIVQHLQLTDAQQFISGFDRPNIFYHIQEKQKNPHTQLLQFIRNKHQSHSGIVYRLSRKKVEMTAEWLQQQGLTALPYHAGLSSEMRKVHQQRFLQEDNIIIVATVAFGMGIDKASVRFVAHLDMPKSIESYYQETGRAGRDGLSADAWMLYNTSDFVMLKRLLTNEKEDRIFQHLVTHRLEAMLGFCELATCRRQVLLNYFGDIMPTPCGNCDVCKIQQKGHWDATEAAQKLLSCMYRTGQKYGAHYLIHLLHGRTTGLREASHQHLSTFGIGEELDENTWHLVIRQLIVQGYITLDLSGYGSLQLTSSARAVLRKEAKVHIRTAQTKKNRHKTSRQRSAENLTGTDQILWNRLTTKRQELAEALERPLYQIVHNSVLVDMVRYRPSTRDMLAKIHGIGAQILEKYGDTFLGVITAHEAEHHDCAQEDISISPCSETVQATLDLVKEGKTVQQAATIRGLKPQTIYQHCAQGVEIGLIPLESVLSLANEELTEISDYMMEQIQNNVEGKVGLTSVYEYFGQSYDYRILSLVRAHVTYELNKSSSH